MKIAISTAVSQGSPDSPFEARFGRAAGFVIVDTQTGDWEAFPNPALKAGGGAGVQVAQFVADQGVQVAISGDFGPKAYQALTMAGIQMFLAPTEGTLTVAELLTHYQQGQLKPMSSPSHPSPAPGRNRD